jgi:ABC-type nitrate/sulfonate/bicarbonate transport system permease component
MAESAESTSTLLLPDPEERIGSTRRRRQSGSALPLRGLLPLAVGLTIWQIVGDPDSPYFPPPSEWARGLTELWSEGLLGPAVSATLTSFLLGFVLAVVLGSFVGCLVGRSRTLDRAVGPLFEYLRVIPPAAVVPIAVLVSGYTESMKLSVVVFASIWTVLLQVRTTARTVNPTLLDVGRSVGMSRLRASRTILLPSIVSGVIAGARLVAPVVLIVVLLVELLTQIDGIGSLIERSRQFYLTERVYGLIVLAGSLALVINLIVSKLESVAARKEIVAGGIAEA